MTSTSSSAFLTPTCTLRACNLVLGRGLRLLTLLLLPLLSGVGELTAQCSFSSVRLSSQAEVDAYGANPPNCTRPNFLSIGPSTDIVDLSPLESIESAFILNIRENEALTSLEALTNLVSAGQITISSNPLLTNIDWLDVTRAQAGFTFQDNPLVTAIVVPDLTSNLNIRTIDITDNDNLTTITGPSTSFTFEGRNGSQILISDNPNLTTITGFDMMDDLEGEVMEVSNNPLLQVCGIVLLCRQIDFDETPIVANNGSNCSSLAMVEQQCDAILPVDLLSFTGAAEGKTNVLQWSVANEESFSHYELERSGNREGGWTTLAEVSGAAAGAEEDLRNYLFTDE